LITAILELELAEDPLTQANLSLQESFIDEFEQATKHLEDQKRLVNTKIETLANDKEKVLTNLNSL
jgi:hypothetical protein